MIAAYHLGQSGQAAALMQEGCEIFEKLGDPLSKEMSLVVVDPVMNTSGSYAELVEVRQKKLAYAREAETARPLASTSLRLGKPFATWGIILMQKFVISRP